MNDEQYQYLQIKNEIIGFHNIDVIEKSYSFRPYHRHNAYEIYLFLRGNTNFYLEQSCYHLKPGDLIIADPSELHRAICLDESPYERYGINIKPSLIERLSSPKTNLLTCFQTSQTHNNLVHLDVAKRQRFIHFFELIGDTMSKQGYGYDLLIDTQITQLLLFINECYLDCTYQPKDIMPELVKDTMEYIQEHITGTITLDDLGRLFYRNGSYISQQFKRYTGLTIRDYIVDQRICLAKTLLLQGKNVTEACNLSGFSDYSNFIRSFTKQTGISPGKYKNQMLTSIQ